jgi:uncharacterized protein YjbI with pentapeptide repeats
MVEANLEKADLTGAIVADAKAKEAGFHGAILEDVIFTGSNLDKADFSYAILLGADLSGLVKFEEATFYKAQWNDDTQLPPGLSTDGMQYVPEPGGTLSLAAGVSLLAIIGRSRSRS